MAFRTSYQKHLGEERNVVMEGFQYKARSLGKNVNKLTEKSQKREMRDIFNKIIEITSTSFSCVSFSFSYLKSLISLA